MTNIHSPRPLARAVLSRVPSLSYIEIVVSCNCDPQIRMLSCFGWCSLGLRRPRAPFVVAGYLDALRLYIRRLCIVLADLMNGNIHASLTGLLSICCRLLRPFLMWLLRALESRGFRSSKLQSSSAETDITAPQLSNSPQYWTMIRLHKHAIDQSIGGHLHWAH